MTSRILGTGSCLPDRIVTNDDLAQVVDTSDEWIYGRTGIKQRRISDGKPVDYYAAEAAKKALENAKVAPEEIELILVATFTPGEAMPNTACLVQKEIGAVNATCFDINAACSGFLFALQTAHSFMQSGFAKKALVIGAETLSKTLDWSDRSTCVLFGDGAGAAVLGQDEVGVIDFVSGSDGTKGSVLTCSGREFKNPFAETKAADYMAMNGQEVFKFAVKKVPECIQELLAKTGIAKEDVDLYILHQANIRIISSVAKRLQVEPEHFPANLEKYGNTSAASIPILLDELNQEKKLARGKKYVLSGFGGGLTWSAAVITF